MPARDPNRTSVAVQRRAEKSIVEVRRHHVILDSELAAFYGVETGTVIRAMKRNANRFPEDFAFQLTDDEWDALRRQNGISNTGRGGRRYKPYVFTEQGALQLAGVLRSGKADEVSVAIARAFVTMRDRLNDLAELAKALPEIRERLEALEGDVAILTEDAAEKYAEIVKLADGQNALKDLLKAMRRAERTLPPAM